MLGTGKLDLRAVKRTAEQSLHAGGSIDEPKEAAEAERII